MNQNQDVYKRQTYKTGAQDTLQVDSVVLVETLVFNRYKCIGKIFWNCVNGLVDTVGSGFPELPQILTVRCRNHLGFISAWFDTCLLYTSPGGIFFKDRELSEKKSRAVSEAERTGSGDFVYCDRDEAEKRKSERQF